MNNKAFKLSNKIEILLFRDVNDHCEPIAKIYAYWIDYSGYPKQYEEEIVFENVQSVQSFIHDFSEASALKWFENNVPENEE